ncbi:MAG: ion transporter [Acidobacteriota bacterium]|nr:MAG: ion transporter [Acidobacteriota bacterium]
MRPFQLALYEVIFEADTPGGKLFDVALLVAIVLSVLTVILESVTGIREDVGSVLYAIEWIFTLLFTVEYLLRLVSVLHPAKYALSFFGLIDLLAIIPTYLSLFLTGAQTLLVIRVFRLLRLFRIFKLTRYIGEARILRTALEASRYKITVFLLTVMAVVVLIGSLMYLIEGPTGGFTSIPRGIYWAIVTMTTVGYGDIAPQTVLGQAIAALLMITGYGVIAVPTGIVSAELTHLHRIHPEPIACPGCGGEGHESDARHCKYCGTRLLDG